MEVLAVFIFLIIALVVFFVFFNSNKEEYTPTQLTSGNTARDNTIAPASFTPPQHITPIMARYIYNSCNYDKKLLQVLIADLSERGLLEIRIHAGALALVTLVDSDVFEERLPELEYNAIVRLIGYRFNAGRIMRFHSINRDEMLNAETYLEKNLRQQSYLFPNIMPGLLGFRKYLEIGEATRLPGAKPEDHLLWIRKHLQYLPYALAFDLENIWAKVVGADVMEGYLMIFEGSEKEDRKPISYYENGELKKVYHNNYSVDLLSIIFKTALNLFFKK